MTLEQSAHSRAPRTGKGPGADTRKGGVETEQGLAEQLNERFAEIATLTRLLADAEHSGSGHDWRLQWLLKVAPLIRGQLLGRGRFPWQRPYDRRLMNRLKAEGLFDAAAYLDANPDVRAAGVDPLLHFLAHGISEGRALGI